MKKWIFTILGLVVVLGTIIGLKATQIASLIGFATAAEEQGMPPVAVATALAIEDQWEESLRFVGTLSPVQGVTLTAEVGGILSEILVENGAGVKKGDVLFILDATQEKAELASAVALLRLARLNLDRSKGLLQKKIIAVSELDSAQAEFEADQARVDNLQAIIDKKIIRAPFDGKIGIRKVNLGQTIKQSDELIPVHQSDPIFVDFAVPQTRLAKIHVGQSLRVESDGLEEPALGKITAINPMVDESTRTAMVQGLLDNPGDKLRPGQFARVDVIFPEKQTVVSVPGTAIVHQAYGDLVFVVVEEEGKQVVRQQFVQVGMRRGDFVEIVKGLSAGDRVVSAGGFKLANGASVTIDDSMQPEVSLTPDPKNS